MVRQSFFQSRAEPRLRCGLSRVGPRPGGGKKVKKGRKKAVSEQNSLLIHVDTEKLEKSKKYANRKNTKTLPATTAAEPCGSLYATPPDHGGLKLPKPNQTQPNQTSQKALEPSAVVPDRSDAAKKHQHRSWTRKLVASPPQRGDICYRCYRCFSQGC